MQTEQDVPGIPLFIHGHGCVSSACIGAEALYRTCVENAIVPTVTLERQLGDKNISYSYRPVDGVALRAAMPKHPRLRRASDVTKYAVTAAHEAIGQERLKKLRARELNIGIILTFLNGCVNYSNRFFGEVLSDPTLASPMIFPETVFNAPASHIAASLECDGPVYTLIGDSATWFSAFTIAQEWIADGHVDGCLILCAEEIDWLTLEGLSLYSREFIATEGAAAVYVEANLSDIAVTRLNGPFNYTDTAGRREAISNLFSETPAGVLVDGLTNVRRIDSDEASVTESWKGKRLSPAAILGEGMGIRCGLQTIAAIEALRDGSDSATILASGGNQHAFSATLTRNPS